MTLAVADLTHRYGDELAVEDVSFGVETGELVALVGPSGCGKTTVVQSIAGHVTPTAGRISLRGDDVTDARPEHRRVGLVFQRSTLYPHMSVGENVAYGLKARNIDPGEREELVREYLDLVSLRDQRTAYPAELSGGQRRRVELARALAPQPDVLLLDEPLSALDRALREELRDEIARIQRETGVTTLFVTHDQEDAMALADRLIVMKGGRITGIGQPRALYQSPPTPFIASFLGRSNTFAATVRDRDPLTIALGDQAVTLGPIQTDASAGATVTCYVHPEYLSVRPPDTATTNPSFRGTVTNVADIGRHYELTVELDTGDELVVEQSSMPSGIDDDVAVEFPADRMQVFGPDESRPVGAPTS